MGTFRKLLPWVVMLLAFAEARATSFVVPDDSTLFDRADAVVRAEVVREWSQVNVGGWPETVAEVRVTESFKGPHAEGSTVEVYAPGGILPGRAWLVHAAPRWLGGSEVVLFLFESRPGRWALVDLSVGKFRLFNDARGRSVAVRQDDIEGTDLSGKPFSDRIRRAPAFVAYLRELARGRRPTPDYFLPTEALPLEDTGSTEFPLFGEASVAAPITYTMEMGVGGGARWSVFPSPVNWRHFNAAAVAGSAEASSLAINVWNAEPGSNIAYVLAGASLLGAPNGLFGGVDGENTIRWQTDLPDIPDYSCTAGGTIGLGGISAAGSPVHTHGGNSFYTTIEADIDMNRGIGCAPQDTKNTGLAHELGHTLAFRHSDRSRNGSSACALPLSCSSQAVMRAMLVNGLNGTLQGWDAEAAQAVYPGAAVGCAPSGTKTISAPQSAPPGSGGLVASVPGVSGAAYSWVLTGGTIVAGQGTSNISFQSGAAGQTMRLTVNEVLGGCTTSTSERLISVDWWDVPASNPIRDHVNTITRHGITGGCAAGYYCPTQSVLRSQMAVFLLKAKNGAAFVPPAASGTMFSDVPAGSFGASWIEELARRGITGGCGLGAYCPGQTVSRAQMAVFLLKTRLGSSYVPPPATGRFNDVPAGDPFARWIEDAYVRGITSGCQTSPLRYCPAEPVTRGQMAVFLTRAFGL